MTRTELTSIIKEDKEYYYGNGKKKIERRLSHNPLYQRGRYIIICRKVGYYSSQYNLLSKILLVILTCKKNILGQRLNIEIGTSHLGRRLRIYHNNIIINAGAIIGDDCELYGNNCIGNKGSCYQPLDAPAIGNNVSIGIGTKVIGKVKIANNIQISSMSLVNKDLTDSYSLYGGVPAKKIKSYSAKC